MSPKLGTLGKRSAKKRVAKSSISDIHNVSTPNGFSTKLAASIPEQTLPKVFILFFIVELFVYGFPPSLYIISWATYASPFRLFTCGRNRGIPTFITHYIKIYAKQAASPSRLDAISTDFSFLQIPLIVQKLELGYYFLVRHRHRIFRFGMFVSTDFRKLVVWNQ